VEADAKTAVDVSLDVNMHSKRAEAAKDLSENLSEEEESPMKPNRNPDFCYLDADTGPCKGRCPRYFYDKRSRDCKMFTWGCCLGNDNKFLTKEKCLDVCNPDLPAPSIVEGPPIVEPPVKPNRAPEFCYLNAERGLCKGRFPRYFYDRRSGIEDCKEFIWGGCGGNDNKFLTKEQCLEVCNPDLVGPLVVDPPEIWNNGK